MKDVAARLASLETIQNMLDDEYLRGDLLLLAIVMADANHREGTFNTKQARARLGWNAEKIKRVVETDIPRYEPARDSWTCQVPLIRKEGKCGQPAHNYHRIYNPENGEYEERKTCNRHAEGMEAMARAKKAEWARAGAPTPANNAGGALTRYFHTDELYDWAIPEWKKDLGPDRTPPIPRPKLKAHHEPAPDLSPARRPALGVIKGART